MASLTLRTEFQFTFAPEEVNLICRALRGKMRGDEVGASNKLGRLISQLKATQLQHLGQEGAKLEANIKKAGEQDDPK
jgi:hypothetical protein